jgi:hypothetical protein
VGASEGAKQSTKMRKKKLARFKKIKKFFSLPDKDL